LESTAELVGS